VKQSRFFAQFSAPYRNSNKAKWPLGQSYDFGSQPFSRSSNSIIYRNKKRTSRKKCWRNVPQPALG
jgi:hypothetical protein